MSRALRIVLAFLGPLLTIAFIAATNERPLDDTIQLLSVSFGVSGVVLGVGFVVHKTRGPGIASVALTTAIGIGLIWLAVIVSAVFSAEVRGWLLILLFTAPAVAFPSVFGAALATCAGRAARSSAGAAATSS